MSGNPFKVGERGLESRPVEHCDSCNLVGGGRITTLTQAALSVIGAYYLNLSRTSSFRSFHRGFGSVAFLGSGYLFYDLYKEGGKRKLIPGKG